MNRTIAITNARGFLGEMLCKQAFKKGHRVIGLVFGESQSGRNLPEISYYSILEKETQEPSPGLLDKLNEVDVLIDAGGPHTLDVHLLECDPDRQSYQFDPHLLYDHPEYSTALQAFYSNISTQTTNLALSLPRLKHYIGLSSLSLGHKLDPLEDHLAAHHEEVPITLYEKPMVHEVSPSKLVSGRKSPSKLASFSHPLGLSALRFERLVEGSFGWQHSKILKTIVRIGTLIGHSQTGNYPNLNGIYSLVPFCHQLARGSSLLNRLPFLPLPFSERDRLSLIPVDIAAEAILGFSQLDYEERQNVYRRPNEVVYRHVTQPERDISVRRLFSATLRQLGLQIPPLAIGQTQFMSPIYSSLGLQMKLLELNSIKISANADMFLNEFPNFSMKPMIEYFPKMLEYAQKHLLHKMPARGASL